jgi:hypothetical protein
MLRQCLITLAAIVAAIFSGPHAPMRAAADQLPGVPRVMVWAWERSEDLRGLDPRIGVAYLAATYQWRGEHLQRLPRRQPLKVDDQTPLVAVVRLETDKRHIPDFNVDTRQRLAREIAALRQRPGVRAVQIDFDATVSERTFYRDLLVDTRAALGAFPLSMTALASWCMDDHWIDELPVDEAVPMLFRLGPVNVPFVRAGAAGTMRASLCAGAVGVSTDEPTPALRGGRRAYVFHPRSWTLEAVRDAAKEVTRWQ